MLTVLRATTRNRLGPRLFPNKPQACRLPIATTGTIEYDYTHGHLKHKRDSGPDLDSLVSKCPDECSVFSLTLRRSWRRARCDARRACTL